MHFLVPLALMHMQGWGFQPFSAHGHAAMV